MSLRPGPGLVRDLRTALIAVVVTVLVGASPSLASKIGNADEVDGKSAVSAKASAHKRAGKLVATDKAGHFPADVLPKALDADRLDGLDSTDLVRTSTGDFVRSVAASGSVQTGFWSAWGGGAVSYVGDAVTLPSRLPAAISETRVTMLRLGEPRTAQCPGVGQVAAKGWACLYEQGGGSTNYAGVYDPASPDGAVSGVATRGFGIYWSCTSASCWSYGEWVISAP
jgi:hypothetical protein